MAKGDTGQPQQGYFPNVYKSALETSAGDYNSIMGQYKTLGDSVSSKPAGPATFNPVAPSFASFTPGDYSELTDINNTGGYSEGDINSIRERGISPIRSIYDSAQRGLSRQKALQGGYSPNFGAASAKMAREASDLISKRTNDVNAGIAETVNTNKINAANSLSSIRAGENSQRNSIMTHNADVANAVNEFNTTMKKQVEDDNRAHDTEDFNKILETIKGQQSTYGTTPAVASTIGNQVLSAANTVSGFAPIPARRPGEGGTLRPGMAIDPSYYRPGRG